jgi:hypothetical protein
LVGLGALGYMTDQRDSPKPPDPLDDLVTELLECGAVLSQMISQSRVQDREGCDDLDLR